MVTSKFVTTTDRRDFKKIISKLDKTKSDKKVIAIIDEASLFLTEHDIGWDAVGITFPHDYVLHSQRRKASVAAKAGKALNGAGQLGADARAMLKTAIARHPNWPITSEGLGITNVSNLTVEELIAVAQLMGINQRFLDMFHAVPKEEPAQTELPLDKSGK